MASIELVRAEAALRLAEALGDAAEELEDMKDDMKQAE